MASNLQFGRGSQLWTYWTKGPGLLRWRLSPHPWTTLRDALLSEGVPVSQASGLASNLFKAVFGYWPSEREGVNPVGRG